MSSGIEELSTLLVTGSTRCRLYGREHRLTRETLTSLVTRIDRLLSGTDRLRLAMRGNEMVFRDRGHPADSGPVWALARALGEKGIGLLEILPGVLDEELEEFCCRLGDPRGEEMRGQPHIRIGTASLEEPLAGEETEVLRIRDATGDREDPVRAEARRLLELSRDLRNRHEVRTRDFNEVVLSLLSHFSHQSNLFLNLAEVRDHNLFTYLHTCNVSTLSIGFGLYLGMRGREAFDLGAAALLHDVGKSLVPREILNKPGPLTEEEWELVHRHPEEGARLLMAQPEVNHLAVTVAFEHHMHHGGSGGYPRTGTSPCLHSQLVAIADTFDALFGKRSYNKRFDILEALQILHARRGEAYHPELVDEFDRFITFHLDSFQWEEVHET